MSKRNKVIYSNIEPNPKEAGIWINTNDGNIKVEKSGKWVDDGGDSGDNLRYYRIDWNSLMSFNSFAEQFSSMLYGDFNQCKLVCAVDIYSNGDDPHILPMAEAYSRAPSDLSYFKITKIAVADWVDIVAYADYSYPTWEEGCTNNGSIIHEFGNPTPITKEEFYNLKP